MPTAAAYCELQTYLLGLGNKVLPSAIQSKVGGSDLVQEVHLAMCAKKWDGAEPVDLKAYVAGTLRKVVRKQHRYLTAGKRDVRREQELNEFVGAPKPEREDTPLSELQRREKLIALAEAVKRLDEFERTILELRLDGVLFTEIAIRLDCSVANAEKKHQRAMAKLRGLLAGHVTEGAD